MLDKIFFLIQVYFVISISMTLILFAIRIPQQLKTTKEYRKKWKNYKFSWVELIKNFVILAIGFPIIAMWYGLKEF